jgi:hypothetical protein
MNDAFASALQQKMASLEETMKRKLGGELLSIQVQMVCLVSNLNISNAVICDCFRAVTTLTTNTTTTTTRRTSGGA